jgi:hypothetical protein
MAMRDRIGLSLLGVFVISLLVFAFNSIGARYSDLRESAPKEVIAKPDPNAYCPGLMSDLYKVVTELGNAGSTASVSDIVTLLKEVGTRLSTGYDLQLAGTAERLTAIRTAGLAMLEIRVALLDGGDVTPPALVLKESAEFISASCN